MAREKVDVPIDKRHWHPSTLPGQVVLVTTVDAEGRPNVATKSCIAMAAFGPPPVLMFACTMAHSTARNASVTREFAVNVPGVDLAAVCWAAGSEQGVRGPGRFARYGLTPVAASKVKAPLIDECSAHIECEVDGIREWGQEVAIFGRIVSCSMDPRVAGGDETDRYRALAPFFFLQEGWAAPLGQAWHVAGERRGPRHILTILAVADLGRSAGFYRKAFGWPVRVEVPVYVELELPDGRGLGLYQREAFARNTGQAPDVLPPGAIAGTEIYLQCDDLSNTIESLGAAGARLLSPRSARDWGDEAAYFADPDGNVLVVARPLPEAGKPAAGK